MAHILIIYASTDGHTKVISQYLREQWLSDEHDVTLRHIDDACSRDIENFDSIIIGASIRYGKHQKKLEQFISHNNKALTGKPNAFFSVNAVARKAGKDRPESNPYLQKFLNKATWQPQLIAVFAGKIDYPKYTFFDKHIIRMIMWMTGGPTDPNGCYEFTDWQQVKSFAAEVSQRSR